MFDGQLPEKADADVKKWLQIKAEGQDPKMALALTRNLFGLDTGKLLKEAKVPVRCINSAGGDKVFTPPAPPTNQKHPHLWAVTTQEGGAHPQPEKTREVQHQTPAAAQ